MRNHLKKRIDWEALQKQWESSGLTQRKFCLRHKINFHLFQYYRKSFHAEKDAGVAKIIFKPNHNACVIRLRHRDFILEIPDQFDRAVLREILSVLKEA